MTTTNMRRMPLLALLALIALAACGPAGEDPTCTDGLRNGTETDVDCGGACGACLEGAACAEDTDCLGGACAAGTCAAPGCDDGLVNGTETGVDCGGVDCGPCAVGEACAEHGDCASGLCASGTCAESVSCTNGLLDGDETDVDCGGADCEPCGQGDACEANGDCLSGFCDGGYCETAPTCDDVEQNGGETDIDCGGPDCAPCANGRQCDGPTDCVSRICEGGLCQADSQGDTCSNGVKDPGESDVDCGGEVCPECPFGYACLEPTDCQSAGFPRMCDYGMCGGRSVCFDGQFNGHETDVDCGGPFCLPCEEGADCSDDADCAGDCVEGACGPRPASCSNGVMDGTETDVDCGGGACLGCPDGYRCVEYGDCEIPGTCAGGVCGGMEVCRNDNRDGHETDVDCGGPVCGGCLGGRACNEDADCAAGVCDGGVCTGATTHCDNGLKDGDETAVDCGGSCAGCPDGEVCVAPSDCLSNQCGRSGCIPSLVSVQAGPESLTCATSGETVVTQGLSFSTLVVTSPQLEIDANTVGWYVQAGTQVWESATDASYSGILAVMDRSAAPTAAMGDVVSLMGFDHVEQDCMSVLRMGAGGSADVGPVPGVLATPMAVDAAAFENGGSAAAEPYEGVPVKLSFVQVTDATGYTGPESDGAPRWWFQVGNGIYVANDFGLTDAPPQGAAITAVSGVVKYSHGVYLVVPRTGADIQTGR